MRAHKIEYLLLYSNTSKDKCSKSPVVLSLHHPLNHDKSNNRSSSDLLFTIRAFSVMLTLYNNLCITDLKFFIYTITYIETIG